MNRISMVILGKLGNIYTILIFITLLLLLLLLLLSLRFLFANNFYTKNNKRMNFLL